MKVQEPAVVEEHRPSFIFYESLSVAILDLVNGNNESDLGSAAAKTRIMRALGPAMHCGAKFAIKFLVFH